MDRSPWSLSEEVDLDLTAQMVVDRLMALLDLRSPVTRCGSKEQGFTRGPGVHSSTSTTTGRPGLRAGRGILYSPFTGASAVPFTVTE